MKPSCDPTMDALELARKWKLADFDVVSGFFRGRLGKADAADLGLGVGAAGTRLRLMGRAYLPAILATATMPAMAPTWANCGSPATMSPMA